MLRLMSIVPGVTLLMLITFNASASTMTYLGGANSWDHCKQIARDAGYGACYFGPTIVGGVIITNACSGSQKTLKPDTPAGLDYDKLYYEVADVDRKVSSFYFSLFQSKQAEESELFHAVYPLAQSLGKFRGIIRDEWSARRLRNEFDSVVTDFEDADAVYRKNESTYNNFLKNEWREVKREFFKLESKIDSL